MKLKWTRVAPGYYRDASGRIEVAQQDEPSWGSDRMWYFRIDGRPPDDTYFTRWETNEALAGFLRAVLDPNETWARMHDVEGVLIANNVR